MSDTNKAITKALAIDWIKSNGLALAVGSVVTVSLCVFMLNADVTTTEETATVMWSFNSPEHYYATENVLMAELLDGKTVKMQVRGDVLPPAVGQRIKVLRIRRLFFGERFVWLPATSEKPS